MCPVVFFEMSMSLAAPEDVQATYFVDVRVGRHGRGAALWQSGGAYPKKAPSGRVSLVELRNSDALLEFSFL